MMEQTVTIYKKNVAGKSYPELYNQFAWLMKAMAKHSGRYNLDHLCMERAEGGKIRISATDGCRLHTVEMVIPDCLSKTPLEYNTKGQIIFRVTKTPNFIICFFDDDKRMFPLIPDLLKSPPIKPVCSIDLYGLNAGDKNNSLSLALRKFYQTIDGIKPDWKGSYLSINYLKDLANEPHSWETFCGDKHNVIRFVYSDDLITKTVLLQPMRFPEKKVIE